MNLHREKRFLVIYMIVGIFTFLLIIESFLAVYRKHQTTVVEQQKRQLSVIASVGADYLETYIDEKNLEIQNLFTFKSLGQTPKQAEQNVEQNIKLYWNQSPLYLDYMKYFNLTEIEEAKLIGLSSHEIYEYVNMALRSNELIVGPWRQVNVDNVGIYLFKGIYNEYGKYGVLICRVNLSMVFSSTISKIQLGEQGYLSLSDIDGTFYLHGSQKGIFFNEKEALQKESETMLVGYSIANVEHLNFLVRAKLPYFEIEQPIRITFYLMIGLSVGVFAIFGILTYLVFCMRKKKLEYTMDLRLQEQIHQESRNETIGIFSRKIAHEYNNLLTPITIYCDLIKDELGASDETLKEYVEEIYRSCEECTKLAKDLLAYGHSMPSERIDMPYDSTEVIRNTIKRVQLILPEQIKLKCHLPSSPVLLLGQPMEFVQILYNLCINSMHAMEEGGTLTVSLKVEGKEVILTISDTGCGIPKHLIKKLFVTQFTTKADGKGNGLGLSIVAAIAEKYTGRVTCTSKENKGTTFSVYLPVYVEEEKQLEG